MTLLISLPHWSRQELVALDTLSYYILINYPIILTGGRSIMYIRTLLVYILASLLALSLGCSSSSTGNNEDDTTPPPVPTGLTLVSIANGAASLTWDKVSVSDIKGYYIYWLGGGEVDILNSNREFVETNSSTISDLDYSTTYFFGVTAFDKSGNESALSGQVNGKPLNNTGPLAPQGVTVFAENIDFPKITISWSTNTEPDLDHYRIYRGLASSDVSDTLAFVSGVDTQTYVDTDVEASVPYYYRITAVDREGWESASSTVVSDYVLPKVMLVSPVNYKHVSPIPTFDWEEVNGAVGYSIVVRSNQIGGEIWNTTIEGSTTQITYGGHIKLIIGNTYYWIVGAISKSEINSISEVGKFVIESP